jgi:hypothetical protein
MMENLPQPPPPQTNGEPRRGIATRYVVIVGIVGVVVGAVVGVLAAPREDSATTGARTVTVTVSAEAAVPPAAGTTGETGATGSTGAAATGAGSSQEDPMPLGSVATLGEWTVTVAGVTPNADSVVERENQFNDKPRAGYQYVLVTLDTRYNGNGSSNPWADLTWAAVSNDGNLYESPSAVIPKDLSDVGNVPSGVRATGNILLEVPKTDVRSVVLYLEGYTASFDTEGVFLALT